MKTFLLPVLVAFLLLSYPLLAQDNPSISQLVTNVNNQSKTKPVEKAYLHFNKPFYTSGDTIYFKAYVTLSDRHWLTSFSEVLHVELIAPDNKVLISEKIQLKNGLGTGDFSLPTSLTTGNYRVRAYTLWMLNEGEKYFFDKPIPIASLNRAGSSLASFSTVSVRNAKILKKPDLQFFPEGGSAVNGIESVFGFKAIDSTGIGIAIEGKVLDNLNHEVVAISATHRGMGRFILKPESGKQYFAVVKFGDGSTNRFALPSANPEGLTLNVNTESPTEVNFTVRASEKYFRDNKGKNITITIYSGGVATHSTQKLENAVVPFQVHKASLFSGTALISLFTNSGEPVAERLIFLKPTDLLDLNVRADKSEYLPGEKVDLTIAGLTKEVAASGANLSVAVVDQSIFQAELTNYNSITSYLLLSSEVTGYIEDPAYYFTNNSKDAADNLDVLMLTQGYRKFSWSNIAKTETEKILYMPEKHLQIGGLVTNKAGKAVVGTPVHLVDQERQGPELSAVTDSTGHFVFGNLFFKDTVNFIITTNKSTDHIQLQNPDPFPIIMAIPSVVSDPGTYNSLISYVQDRQNKEGVPLNSARLLKQVNIKASRVKQDYRTASLAGAGQADQVLFAKDVNGGGTVIDILTAQLKGVAIRWGLPYLRDRFTGSLWQDASPMLIVIDGSELDQQMFTNNGKGKGSDFTLNDLSWADVESVEVLKSSNASAYGVRGGNGVLIITTKQGSSEDAETTGGSSKDAFAVAGLYTAKTFYSPKYNTSLARSLQPVYTTYWNPEVVLDATGKADISFYNGSAKGKYYVIIEGIGAKGNLGSRIFQYVVK